MTLFWIYVVCQLVSTAYGITVINSARRIPALRKRLRESGYTKRDKNSLYKFNDWLSYFFKGFIPFYYAYKAIQLTNSADPVGMLMNEEINNGNYISKEDEAIFKDEEQRAADSLAYDPNIFKYEEPGTYKARKIDINEIYDDYETPIEYITREFEKDSNNKITPFVDNHDENINNNIHIEKEPEIIEIKDKKDEDEVIEVKNSNVTNSDIAKAISELSGRELEELSKKLVLLAESKRNDIDNLEKDVA